MEDMRIQCRERLRRYGWLMRRNRSNARAGHGRFADPTRGQGRVLAALQLSSPIPTRDLAFLLGMRQQSLNELIVKLEADGYITRAPSLSDKRVMEVHLTDEGAAVQVGAGLGGVDPLKGLSDEQVASLMAILDTMIATLEEGLGIDEGEAVDEWKRGARRRLDDDRLDQMLLMRERGFGFEGHGRGKGHGHGRGGCGCADGHGRGHCDGRKQRRDCDND